jgi:hypothetical protein
MTRPALSAYIELIGRFVAGQLPAAQFEAAFLRMFKNETARLPDDAFQLLDELFADIDDYVSDPELCSAAGGLGDEELRTRAESTLARLRSI